jgi:TolB-like protein/Tfp pilus assembly protein PilF
MARLSPRRTEADPSATRLESWKEIAAYFKRDVTTVRRWERQEGLPIHRLHHRKLGSVFAYRSELDDWRGRRAAESRRGAEEHERIRALAVLPLENLSGDADDEYFADGMTEVLITQLSGLHRLRVISRTSAMQIKHERSPIPEIARLLDVDAIVEGTVARSDGRVRITAQLVNGRTAENIWARKYERKLSDVLRLQSDVAQAIARQIEVAVTPDERRRLAATRAVAPDVYETYLKGRFQLAKYTRIGLEESVRHFESAIAADQTYAPAHAGLAVAYDLLGTFFIGLAPPSAMRVKAVAAATRAIELDPSVGAAHTVMANARQQEWEWGEAEDAHHRAIDLNPSDAIAHLGLAGYLAARGHTDEAIAEAGRAREHDPLSLQTRSAMGVHLYFARRFDEAIGYLRGVQEVEPNHVWSLWHLGLAFLETSRFDEAIEVLERTVAVSDRSATPLGSLAMAYGRAGRHQEAQQIVGELDALRLARYVPPAAFLHAWTGLGDCDRAFDALEGAYQERSFIVQFLKVLPLLDRLRNDRRFVEMLRRVALA